MALLARRFGSPDAEIAGSFEGHGSERRWCELAEHFAPEQIVELLVLVGLHHAISFVTNALEIDLEPGAERFPPGLRPASRA